MSKASLYIAPLRAIAAVLLALAAIVAAPRAFAQANSNPPERMTYQGFLVDANGNALAPSSPKNYDVIFRIWNDSNASGAANRLWTEQQTVTVDKGYFSVLLGEGSAIGEARPELSTLFTNATASDRWVGLTVKGIGAGGTDVNILPRLRLLTSPYAFLARSVSGSGVVGTNNLSPAVASALWTANGANVYRGSGNVGIGSATPGQKLEIAGGNLAIRDDTSAGMLFQNAAGAEAGALSRAGNSGAWSTDAVAGDVVLRGTAGKLLLQNGSGSAGLTLNNNFVGVGTPSPTDLLHVRATSPRVRAESTANSYAGFLSKNTLSEWFTGVDGGTFWEVFENAPSAGTRLVVASGGSVGIGTTTPAARLQVVGGAIMPAVGSSASAGIQFPSDPYGGSGDQAWLRYYSRGGESMTLELGCANDPDDMISLMPAGGVGIGSISAAGYKLFVNGQAYATGGFFPLSDRRMKKDFTNLTNPLQSVLALHGVSFDWRREEFPDRNLPAARQIGFIAQEVQQILPEAVIKDTEGYYAVNYDAVVPVLVEAMKEQQRDLEAKAARITELERRLGELEGKEKDRADRFAALESLVRDRAVRVQPASFKAPASSQGN